jgi:hypothetical protein
MSSLTASRLQQLQAEFGSGSIQPVTIAVSPGRCGTVFLKHLFEKAFGDRGEFLHERLSAHQSQPAMHFRCYTPQQQEQMLGVDTIYEEIRRILNTARSKPVCEFGHYFISTVPIFQAVIPNSLRVLALHRHPLQSAASHAIKGHYTINKSRLWAITPTHERVFHPEYAARWDQMSAYEKELYRWLQITKYGFELPDQLPGLHWKVVASRDLFKSRELQAEIAAFCGFPNPQFPDVPPTRNETTDFNRETTPIGEEWRRTPEHREVVQLAESLGYDMSLTQLETMIKPYQRPPGLAAMLRNLTGYWYVRKWLGLLRAPAEE